MKRPQHEHTWNKNKQNVCYLKKKSTYSECLKNLKNIIKINTNSQIFCDHHRRQVEVQHWYMCVCSQTKGRIE